MAPRPLELTQVKQPYLIITVNFEINISEIKQRDCLCVRLLLTSKDWREVSWQHFDHPTSSVLIYTSIILVHLTLKLKQHCDFMDSTQMTRPETGKIKIESKTVEESPSCYLVRRNSRNLKPLQLLALLILKGPCHKIWYIRRG